MDQPPQFGPQRPVALEQPDAQVRDAPPLSRRDEARLRAEQRKAEQYRRRAERRQQDLLRREQAHLRRAEEIRAGAERQPRRQVVVEDDDDDDVRDQRPFVTRRERAFDAPPPRQELPFFRLFGAN